MPKHYCIFPLHQQLHLGAHLLYSYCTATSKQNIHSNNSHHSPTCIPSYNTARTRMAWATGLIVFWTARLECNGHCTAISETIARIYFLLHYSLDKPISTKGHSGTLSTLIHHCILWNPLIIQHTQEPPPPTYNRGTSGIDYIFISHDLLPSITRSEL